MTQDAEPNGPEDVGIRPRTRQGSAAGAQLFAPPNRAAGLSRRLSPVRPADDPAAGGAPPQPGADGEDADPLADPTDGAGSSVEAPRSRVESRRPASRASTSRAVSSAPAAGDGAARTSRKTPVMLYVSPALQAALKDRVSGRQRTLENQVIDSVERTAGDGRLRGALGGGTAPSSLGFTREPERQPVEARTPVSFRTHPSNVVVFDRLVQEYGARDRNHLITTALQLDLLPSSSD